MISATSSAARARSLPCTCPTTASSPSPSLSFPSPLPPNSASICTSNRRASPTTPLARLTSPLAPSTIFNSACSSTKPLKRLMYLAPQPLHLLIQTVHPFARLHYSRLHEREVAGAPQELRSMRVDLGRYRPVQFFDRKIEPGDGEGEVEVFLCLFAFSSPRIGGGGRDGGVERDGLVRCWRCWCYMEVFRRCRWVGNVVAAGSVVGIDVSQQR